MDDETRFWIAKEVADTKYTADITPLFRDGKDFAGKARPRSLLTELSISSLLFAAPIGERTEH